MPEQKLFIVDVIKARGVYVIGDGVNDVLVVDIGVANTQYVYEDASGLSI